MSMGDKKVETEMQVGPMSTLQHALTNQTQVVVNCRNNRKLLGRVKAFDRHLNIILEDVREMWQETARKGKGRNCATKNMDRYISKVFVRGDSIVMIVKNPRVTTAALPKGKPTESNLLNLEYDKTLIAK